MKIIKYFFEFIFICVLGIVAGPGSGRAGQLWSGQHSQRRNGAELFDGNFRWTFGIHGAIPMSAMDLRAVTPGSVFSPG